MAANSDRHIRIVDDNDPLIKYSPSGWATIYEDGDWKGTLHSTSVLGSWAAFNFTGSLVRVICTISTGNGFSSTSAASFQIDDKPAVSMSHIATPAVQWEQTFWDSGLLPYAEHHLNITYIVKDAYFRLDRIEYDPNDGDHPSQKTVITPTKTAADITQSTIATLLQTTSCNFTPVSADLQITGITTTGSATPEKNAESKSNAKSMIGKIVAGILGAALLAIIIVALLRIRRRRVMRHKFTEKFEALKMVKPRIDVDYSLPASRNKSFYDTDSTA